MRDGFGQFCPVAAACEIFAQRWTPLILRELLAGSHRFNEIHRCVPRMSRGLLTRRLGELEAAGVITSEPSTHGRGREYHLSESGREFRAVIEALGTWGQRWTVRVRPGHLDAELLMWNLRRRIALDRLPARRVVVRFHFTGAPATYRGAKTFWLVLEPADVELCLRDPGHEVDLFVDADLAAMSKVWLGDLPFEAALRSGRVRLAGAAPLVRQFPSWLLLSSFAAVPRPAVR